MHHGRIETTPEQQLVQLRQAYSHYAALADRLHEDDAVEAHEREARERDARRIALAYEKTIASAAMRMESLHRTRAEGAGFTRLAKGLSVMLAGAVIVCGALVMSLRPDISRTLLAHLSPRQDLKMAQTALAPAMPAAKAAAKPAPNPTSVAALPVPPSLPAEVRPKQTAKPAIAPPKEEKSMAPRASAPPAPVRQAELQAPAAKPAEPPASEPAPSVAAAAPSIAAPTPSVTAPAPQAAAPQPAQTPATQMSAPQTPAPQTIEPLAPPREVAALPSPPQAETPQAAARETPASPPARQASLRPVPVMRTHLRPPYPIDAKRAGEHGTTLMEVAISPQGAITECTVTGSSGSERLDSTACSFVQRYWRWQPRDVPGTTKISVIWNLIAGK